MADEELIDSKRMKVRLQGACCCGGGYQAGYVDGEAAIMHSLPPCEIFEHLDAMEYLRWIQRPQEPN